jgi:hypothetical protein
VVLVLPLTTVDVELLGVEVENVAEEEPPLTVVVELLGVVDEVVPATTTVLELAMFWLEVL